MSTQSIIPTLTPSQDFTELLEENLTELNMRSGSIIPATVTYIDESRKLVVVDAGLKTDAVIPLEQFYDEHGELTIKEGGSVDVMIEMPEDGSGEAHLSREKAKRAEDWEALKEAHRTGAAVEGTIEKVVKGGLTVVLKSIRAFLPRSLVDVRPVRDLQALVGQTLELKIVKVDEKRGNMVVSRRSMIEQEYAPEHQVSIEELNEGQELEGIVKNITDYGIFVDLGGIDGLLHITDIAWKRVNHPSELYQVGDKARVKILKIDREKGRVSLGMKQLTEDPWLNLVRRYPAGTRLFGKVTNLTDYGCFVEIEDGIEGLVHMSEMDWTNRSVHPSKVVKLGMEVEVMVLEVDEERRRISLGMKQCISNPWANFAETHKEGDTIEGQIKSITDFGIFVGLEGEIDGLIHLTDISWTQPGEVAIREYQKGEAVKAVVLGVDPERERISLGIKQLESDPKQSFLENHPKGSSIKGKILEVDAKQAIIDLGSSIKGSLLASEYGDTPIEDLSKVLSVDDEVEAYVLGIDKKGSTVQLTTRSSRLTSSESSTASRTKEEEPKGTTLGDLIKEQLKGKEED
jgi:small subunit ribosomal protein S1